MTNRSGSKRGGRGQNSARSAHDQGIKVATAGVLAQFDPQEVVKDQVTDDEPPSQFVKAYPRMGLHVYELAAATYRCLNNTL